MSQARCLLSAFMAMEAPSDDNPRPAKRARIAPLDPSTTTHECPDPPAILLLSLPGLLVHPPNHRYHVPYLFLSLRALRRCVAIEALDPGVECRAWAALAEVGMQVIEGGFSESGLAEYGWASGVEIEVSEQ